MEFAVRFSEFVSWIGLENDTRSGGGWMDRACEVIIGSSIFEDELVRGFEVDIIAYPDIGIFPSFLVISCL